MVRSLSECISNDHKTIFKGIERGGTLNVLADIPSNKTVDYNKIYDEKYKTPYYLTLIPNKSQGRNHFIIQLDEYYPVNGKLGWYKRFGAGYLVEQNVLVFNENEGISSRLTFVSENNYTLYRERNTVILAVSSSSGVNISSPKYPFVNAGSASLSCKKEKTRDIQNSDE